MNIPLYEKVLKQIKEHPDAYNQEEWHSSCGTKHCFGGWAVILAGRYNAQYHCGSFTRYIAAAVLELEDEEADYLFFSQRTMDDFERFLLYAKRSVDTSEARVAPLQKELAEPSTPLAATVAPLQKKLDTSTMAGSKCSA